MRACLKMGSFLVPLQYNYKMEVYFTEKEKKVEVAPQPQLDIFDLMAQPMVAKESDVPAI